MFAQELKSARILHARIDKIVPCIVEEITIKSGYISMKLESVIESESDQLLIELERQTGVQSEWHSFSGEYNLSFEFNDLEVEINL
jgi:hypothetical protein